jgi:hypothetical protein
MPEYVILISAIACAGAGAALYFNRNNVPALAVAILGAIVLLYGIGQYFDRDNSEARALGFTDASDRRAAQVAGVADAEKWKLQKSRPAQTAPPVPPTNTTKQDAVAAASPPSSAEESKAEPLPARQPLTPTESAAKVTIANFTSKRAGNRYVEVSGTVINRNEFAIKNIVVTCGDRSYAAGDVSITLDKVMPPRSDLAVANLRLGPIRPELPPTSCAVARYERAN